MKVTLIHNPGSGSGVATVGQLEALIREAGYECRTQSTKEKGWSKVLRKRAALVAVAGGDGTVGKVARRLIGRGVPIAILPMGTANNISKTLGILNMPLTMLIGGWKKARAIKFDAGIARGPWGTRQFIEGFGLGFVPSAVRAVQRHPTMRTLGGGEAQVSYALQFMRERITQHEPTPLKVTIDGKDISGDYVLFEVMNMKYIGPNLYLAPDLQHNNGMFEVVCVQRRDRRALARVLAHWQDGQPWPSPLEARPARKIQFEWTGFPVHIDDKLWPSAQKERPPAPPQKVELEAIPAALCFVVPAELAPAPKPRAPARRRRTR
jgi:diacylglycerol kinase (ATP)